jgi:hypothetical protein
VLSPLWLVLANRIPGHVPEFLPLPWVKSWDILRCVYLHLYADAQLLFVHSCSFLLSSLGEVIVGETGFV